MAKKGIISFYGFDELLKKIEDAGGTIDGAVTNCVKESEQIVQEEMKAQMRKKKVASDLIRRMPKPTIEKSGNAITARVGYKKGKYNPKKLSDGYKAVFINYGTPRIKPRKFIDSTKRKARPQIKKMQEEALNEILKGLKS